MFVPSAGQHDPTVQFETRGPEGMLAFIFEGVRLSLPSDISELNQSEIRWQKAHNAEAVAPLTTQKAFALVSVSLPYFGLRLSFTMFVDSHAGVCFLLLDVSRRSGC